MADVKIVLDEQSLQRVLNSLPGLKQQLTESGAAIAGRANALSAGFRTHYPFYDKKSGEVRGGTQPVYVSEPARKGKSGLISIVHPKNYAAMKDNYKNNTMLKAR